MTSALRVLTCGLSADVLAAAIPPQCRGAVETRPPSAWRNDGDDSVVESPAWAVAGATHFVPSFAALTAADFSARTELCARVGGAWTPWVAAAGLGPATFAPLPAAGSLDVDIDVFRARVPVDAVRLRVRLRATEPAAVRGAPWMLALSAAGATAPPSAPIPGAGARLAVPALSQMDGAAAIASRICSPTCVAMVLAYWQRPVALEALAAAMFHPGTDLYGVWPAAILAAGRRGLAGYLLRFPDWTAAAWCLAHGLPVIASIRYEAGELEGAAIGQTSGHLIVLTGWEDDVALVNDPAAPSAAAVPRRYSIAQLCRVWLERAGVGYVIFAPDAPTQR
jgi:hypothetical protein